MTSETKWPALKCQAGCTQVTVVPFMLHAGSKNGLFNRYHIILSVIQEA